MHTVQRARRDAIGVRHLQAHHLAQSPQDARARVALRGHGYLLKIVELRALLDMIRDRKQGIKYVHGVTSNAFSITPGLKISLTLMGIPSYFFATLRSAAGIFLASL